MSTNKQFGAARKARCKLLIELLGIPPSEASNLSLEARLAVIAKLKTARQRERARGRTRSWLYDLNRHLNLCAQLRSEYEDLVRFLAEDEGRNACQLLPSRSTVANDAGVT